jgi:hypothetical protein
LLSNVFDTLGFDQAVNKAAQAGDVLGAVSGPNPAAVLVVVPSEDVVVFVFDSPAAAVDLQQASGIGLLGTTAGDAVGEIAGGLAGLFVDLDAFDGEGLSNMREV